MPSLMDDKTRDLAAEAGNVKKRAFRDLEKLSRSFLGLLLIAPDLAEIGDLEEARAKAQRELDDALTELAGRRLQIEQTKLAQVTINAECSAALSERRNELRQAEAAVADARATAERTTRDATVDAERRLEAAATEALSILANARAAAAVLVSEAEELAKKREGEADTLVAERRETLSALDRDIAEREATRASIRAAIAKMAAE